MAGMTSVRTTSHTIPAPKVGTDFLAGSHFQISQDPTATAPSMRTTFKIDYHPHDTTGRPDAAKPPPPGPLMHIDDRHFNDKCSETVKAYEYKYLKKPLLPNPYEKLSATNFKMDRDLSKFDSFHTTHNAYFPPKDCSMGGALRLDNPLASHVPQGDKEKEPIPASDYRDRYRGHDTSVVTVPKAPNQHTSGPPTITGDARLHHYDTTVADVFRGNCLPKIVAYPAPVGTNVPQGDKEKENTKMTTQQESYPPHRAVGPRVHHKGQNRITNFNLSDGKNGWNNYTSTATEAYTVKDSTVDRNKPKKHRNHSDFPPGDSEPGREADRVNMTTSRYYHGEYPSWFRNTIVSGAQKRTKSNVWFGEPAHNDQFYATTVSSNFQPKSVPYTYEKGVAYKPSIIPLDYYGNEQTVPTSFTDFKDPRQGKTIPNPSALDNLKRTHIQPPMRGERYFSTTHLTHFTPKDFDPVDAGEPGRLQKSSVPLGTFN